MSDMLIRVGADRAASGRGFVGVVRVGERDAYRTLRVFSTPESAEDAATSTVSGALGAVLAAVEWRTVQEEMGAPPAPDDFKSGADRKAERT